MKVSIPSVIIAVRDEAKSIKRLLDGLLAQSLEPLEIVITDGGSQDNTRKIIRDVQFSSPLPILLVEDKAAFPGRGRNLAIGRASGEWLAIIDGGTVPDKDWLKELVAAAKSSPQARIIYGKYLPVTNSYFTYCAAIAYVPPPNSFSPFIASSLMHRSAWEEAGGFREDLRSGEDLLFFKRISELKITHANTENAVVHWSLEPSWAGTLRRFATYSRYGMRAGLAREWQFRVALLYLMLLALGVAAALLWWPVTILPLLFLILRTQRRIFRWHAGHLRHWRKIMNPRLVLTVLSINFVIDLAMFWGILQWLVRDVLSNERQLGPVPSNN